MTGRGFCTVLAGGLAAALAFAQAPAAKPAAAAAKIRRAADGHPDLSGMWEYAIDRAPASLKKVVNGKETLVEIDQSARHRPADLPGSLPWTKAPSYKPEYVEKVKYNVEHESKVDGVFYCGRPGVPRIGSPRRVVQLKDEFIFLYEDISGDPYRVVPVVATKSEVAKKHRVDGNPSFYGDSVGYWDGDTLVVESVNFVDEHWFGEYGYLHSDALKVTERLWRVGENLGYQVTVEDPKVLTAAWTDFPHLVRPSTTPLEESPACKEDDAHRLLNLDNHPQR